MNKRNIIKLFILLLLVTFIILYILGELNILKSPFSSKEINVSYQRFKKDLDASAITEVVFNDDKIIFTTGDGSFITDNPDSPTLKEELLENNISVRKKDSFDMNNFLDLVFNIIFFGAVGFGIYKLISYNNKTFKIVHKTNVSFSDIAGMENVKKDMIILSQILKDPSSFQNKGIRPVKGVILEGPPGNGKTLFARALAQESGVNFIATKGADFQSAMMSMGARKIKMLFNKASRHKPCIIFIDEFDSIGERRNYTGTGIDKENNRIITTMLNEMDGFSANNGLLVVAATNSYSSLDSALIRPGRFDLKYTITNPDSETRSQLIDLYTKNKVLSKDLSSAFLNVTFEGLSCSAIEALLNQAQVICQVSNQSEITIDHILEASKKTGSRLNIKNRNKVPKEYL